MSVIHRIKMLLLTVVLGWVFCSSCCCFGFFFFLTSQAFSTSLNGQVSGQSCPSENILTTFSLHTNSVMEDFLLRVPYHQQPPLPLLVSKGPLGMHQHTGEISQFLQIRTACFFDRDS